LVEGVAVRWLDTPGMRHSDDPVEQAAVELAGPAIANADVLVAVRDPDQPWPDADVLPRPPDVWVLNKMDQLADDELALSAVESAITTAEAPLGASALTGLGLKALERAVLRQLGLERLAVEGEPRSAADEAQPWPFSPLLRRLLADDEQARLRAYCGLAAL
jgi:tRNA U34 5-carboxymethylaminomethyl modifying GTPase MnmE/TrmE